MAKIKDADPRLTGLAEIGREPFTQTGAADVVERRAFRGSPGDKAGGVGVASAPPEVVPTDPRGFQQYLVSKGAKIAVDGIVGPKTLAAAQKLGVAVPANLAPPDLAATAPTPQPPGPTEDANAPAVTTNVAPPVSPTPADPVQVAADQLREQFGYGSWVIDNPELMGIINEAAQAQTSGTPWTRAQFQTAVSKTAWWTGNSDSQRAWQNLQNSNPGEATAEIQRMSAQLNQIATKEGITIAADRMPTVAADALARGLTSPADLQQQVANEFQYKPGGQTGSIGADEATVKGLAEQYGVSNLLDDSTLASYDHQLSAGTATPASIKQQLVTLAQQRYAGIAKQITVDNPTSNLLSPYKSIAQQELGVNPDTIDFSQPMWMKAVNQIDPNTGAAVPMNLADWTATLRSDPTYGWDKTPNGVNTYYQLGNALTSALGVKP